MQFQNIFDSVCRCFGHAHVSSPNGGVAGQASAASQPVSSSNSTSHSSVKRRTNRLELKDKEWDALFDDGKPREGVGGRPPKNPNQNGTDLIDLEYAQAVAKAKLAANPSRYRSKRKRSGKSPDDIFRSKDSPAQSNSTMNNTRQSTLSRLLNPSVALCFATPVRGTTEEAEDSVLRSQDGSDTNTLNTCEDTITSTLYFDNKYSHVVETQPPMPLFSQFKLGHEKDEIHTIVVTDSHSSLKMIRLLQEVQDDPHTRTPVELEDSSTDSDLPRPNRSDRTTNNTMDTIMDDVPDVKACSTDSSRRSSSSNHSQQAHDRDF
jgi:hypothetical protein